MKENPGSKADDFKGDNFVKTSGDYLNFIRNEGMMI